MVSDLINMPFEDLKGMPVVIEWRDSANLSLGWHRPEEHEAVIGHMYTIGFIIGIDTEKITISHTMAKGHAYDKYSIPVSCITRLEEIPLNASEEQE
jgi:hypothetical protein